MNPSLAQSLRAQAPECMAFIGAGGKTTAMFTLARELSPPLIVTATTHLGAWQASWADRHIIAETPGPLEELEHGLRGVILVTGPEVGDRTQPINAVVLSWLHQFCGYHSIPMLVEADGARQKPLKAWAGHEPPIPSFVERVVMMIGLSGIGKRLGEENVHRPGLFSRLSGLQVGEFISQEHVLQVILHPESRLKNAPAHARKTIILNQADTPELQAIARGMASSLLNTFDSVLIASLQQGEVFAVHEPVAGIILAAGESSRFGEPKQLLDWKGQPFVRAVAKTALEAGLSPVVVVTGAHADEIESALRDLPLTLVRNDEWREGQASSIRAGIRSLPGNAGAGIFLLSDQPQLTTTVLQALVESHAAQLQSILAPMVQDQRANPVLFDRVTFDDLLALTGDTGGRGIFHKYRVEYLPWHDDRLLLDVDTPEMYQRLISDDPL